MKSSQIKVNLEFIVKRTKGKVKLKFFVEHVSKLERYVPLSSDLVISYYHPSLKPHKKASEEVKKTFQRTKDYRKIKNPSDFTHQFKSGIRFALLNYFMKTFQGYYIINE